jgi:adenylate cyclase
MRRPVPQAYDAFLQGWEHYRQQTPEDTAKAIAFLKQAITFDPGYGRAYAALVAAHWRIVSLHWQIAVGVEWLRAYEQLNANLAKALEHPSPLAYSVSAEWLTRQGRSEEALAQIDRALALAPNEADIHVSKARNLNVIGRAEEAEKSIRLAMRLNPHHGPDYLVVLGQALLHQQRYAEAVGFMERAVDLQPGNRQHYVTLAIIYGQLGRTEDARRMVDKYGAIDPQSPPLTVQDVSFWWYGNIFEYDETYRERLREGLRKAGVAEGAGTDVKYADFKRLIHSNAGEYEVSGVTKIDAAQAKVLHDKGALFIDVRNPVEYGLGHILRPETSTCPRPCHTKASPDWPVRGMRSYSPASASTAPTQPMLAQRQCFGAIGVLIISRADFRRGGPVETSSPGTL